MRICISKSGAKTGLMNLAGSQIVSGAGKPPSSWSGCKTLLLMIHYMIISIIWGIVGIVSNRIADYQSCSESQDISDLYSFLGLYNHVILAGSLQALFFLGLFLGGLFGNFGGHLGKPGWLYIMYT